jgi:hypothetical protein
MLPAIVVEFSIDAQAEVNAAINEYGDLQDEIKPTIDAALAEFRRRTKN